MITIKKTVVLGIAGPCFFAHPAIAQADSLNPSDLIPRKSPFPEIPRLPQSDKPLKTPLLPGQNPPVLVDESVQVETFIFKGNTVYSDLDLSKIAVPYLQEPQTLSDLQELTQKISEFYANAGYVATSATIAQQENSKITPDKAVITILITEGKLEAVDIQGADRLEKYIRRRLPKPNTIINEDTILEDIRLLQANPLVKQISASLIKGAYRDRFTLNVEVVPAKQRSLALILDNDRSPSIGSFQRSVDFTDRNLLGLGDTVNFKFSNTDGSNSVQFSYFLPVNSQNGTVGVKYFYGSSKVVEDPFDEVDISAVADYTEVFFRQPIIHEATADSVQEFALGLSFSRETSDFTLLGIPFPVSRGSDPMGETKTSVLRFSQDWSKQSAENVFFARSQFSFGLPILDATINSTGPDGRFFLWRLQGLWGRRLFDDWTITFRSELQLADSPLVPAEQFTLGGFSSARGYRQNLLLGDNGWLGAVELGIPLYSGSLGNLSLAPFFEVGTVWDNQPQLIATPSTLASTGLGLRFQAKDCLSARIDWGIPLINMPDNRSTLQESGVYFSLRCDIL
ncbi:ShlB/FhaC/HecB family hemolysin secretion/activation protein [Acaryochloris marina]|uniref:Surface antigen variable number n=1 Tax=Acaryochloris marina (strain MBIC 11017) TaxID=329726 RepID=A8ZPR7_ACAM1|nr:ShlB/FhaC/HecB family hemolysin secretion/activation protein [Acaryochloris marina]ABW33060.1 surface antigen variable number [Acaryochloris marina MBIC11017]